MQNITEKLYQDGVRNITGYAADIKSGTWKITDIFSVIRNRRSRLDSQQCSANIVT
jgi:hypothetical protein